MKILIGTISIVGILLMPFLVANADYVTEWQCTYSASSSDCIAAATTTDLAISSTTAQSLPYMDYYDEIFIAGVIIFLLMFNPLIWVGTIFRAKDKTLSTKR
jgi:hypothetical protein